MELHDASSSPALAGPTWKPGVRAIVSLLVTLHVMAVIVSPLSIEGSPLAGRLWELFQPYVEAAYLNHGYHFFAPQPGPSHLLRYEVTLADGSQVSGTLPDRTVHRPRLLYHRHFMLTEFLNGLQGNSTDGENYNPRRGASFEAYCQSYANHLLDAHHGQQVTIRLVRHLIPYPDEVAKGQTLQDPKLYQELFTKTYGELLP